MVTPCTPTFPAALFDFGARRPLAVRPSVRRSFGTHHRLPLVYFRVPPAAAATAAIYTAAAQWRNCRCISNATSLANRRPPPPSLSCRMHARATNRARKLTWSFVNERAAQVGKRCASLAKQTPSFPLFYKISF